METTIPIPTRIKNSLVSFLKMAGSSFWALLLGVSIGVSPYIYLSITHSPKLEGRIISIMVSVPYQTLTAFLFIANSRDVPVPIVDYEMLVHYHHHQTERLRPLYIDSDTLSLSFLDSTEMIFPMDKQYLLRKTKTLITRENPLTGFVLFAYPTVEFDDDASDFEIQLIDGFGKTHSIYSSEAQLIPPGILQFLIDGYRFTRKGKPAITPQIWPPKSNHKF